jgi:DNA-binding IclR family transcriptional regulator
MGQSSGIGVLDKVVSVLTVTATSPSGLSELCEATGLPRATAHRLAVGLETHGLLERDHHGRWRPGPLVAGLAGHPPHPLVSAAGAVRPRRRTSARV